MLNALQHISITLRKVMLRARTVYVSKLCQFSSLTTIPQASAFIEMFYIIHKLMDLWPYNWYLSQQSIIVYLQHTARDVHCIQFLSLLSKSPVAPVWRPQSVSMAFKKVADRQDAHCAVASKAVETQWKCFEDAVQSSRTPCGGFYFEHFSYLNEIQKPFRVGREK